MSTVLRLSRAAGEPESAVPGARYLLRKHHQAPRDSEVGPSPETAAKTGLKNINTPQFKNWI